METAEPHQHGCHVVHVGYGGPEDTVRAVCPTLPDDRLGEIERLVARLTSSPRRLAAELRELSARHALPGICVVWNENPFPRPPGAWRSEYYPQTPEPIGVPFEPIELNERELRLDLLGDPNAAERARRGMLPKPPPRRSYIWLFIAFVTTSLGLLATPIAGMPCCVVAAAAPLLILLDRVPLPRSATWFLVPHGVVVRRAGVLRSTARLTVCTPPDTLLLFRPRPPGWSAELIRKNGKIRRFLTRREFEALLRAWSSPLPCPTRFDDLQ